MSEDEASREAIGTLIRSVTIVLENHGVPLSSGQPLDRLESLSRTLANLSVAYKALS